MCCGPERSKSGNKDMNNHIVETEDSFSSLLELASNNDVEGFKRVLERDLSCVDKVGPWYGRQKGSKQIVCEPRTPLMVAATYGSVDVIKLILLHSMADVNLSCGPDESTALHCAASGGSPNMVDVVRLLLAAGADPCCVDANGLRPVDVIAVPPKLQGMRVALEELLGINCASGVTHDVERSLTVSISSSNSSSPILSSSGSESPPSPTELVSSPMASKFNDGSVSIVAEKKEYPIDPSLPDIKNSIYSTDEFRMFSFKIRPCSRAYSHDWTECPFVHPGENARRRDPRKFHYSCVPCPDFRKGSCRRGDMCEYAHGVFECWLHPAQYRTRLCKDGTSCNRRVCFFAHTAEELRPLYVSSGSVVPLPRLSVSSAGVMDMAATLSLIPGSPSSLSAMSPNPFTQPLSPSGNGNMHSSMAWPQPNVPTLNLPGSNIQSSRLRSSLSARDITADDSSVLSELDTQQQIFNDLTCISHSRNNSVSLSRCGRTKTLNPSNLEELFSAEVSSSPTYSDQAVFSPGHKSAVLNQLQQQSMLSPINTNVFSPKNVEHPLRQASFGVGSPGRMSPRNVEPISPMGSRLVALMQREKQQHLHSLSWRDLGSNNPVPTVGSPVNANSLSKWGSPNGKVDWSVNGDELELLRRSSSSDLQKSNGEEPDLTWVQSLVKESPPEMMKAKPTVPASSAASSSEGLSSNSLTDPIHHSVIGAWLEQMQLDQLVV
ncbi:zinc finger CCCH domain-containing protein 30-like [Mangifera indica]|uniref:zinc finger CCCH domain-containing protein 30-like n=1 Tax=Mangifera indica TaxID=29780 RepID=UPI001CF9399E|nr:zinc finger CCCH domain-containing protein 30-like [Mangifera indica]